MITLFILFVVVFLLCKFFNESDDDSFKKIPGPKGFPFIGNIQDYFYNEEKLFGIVRERALEFFPLYKLKVFNKKMVHLFSPDDVEVILKSPRYVSKGKTYNPIRTWIGEGLLTSEGETWRRNRKLLTKCFHFGVLKDHTNTINQQVIQLTNSVDLEKPTDMKTLSTHHSLNISIASLASDPPLMSRETKVNFLNSLKTLTKIMAYRMTLPLVNTFYSYTPLKTKEDESLKTFNDFTSKILEGESTEEQNRLVDMLRKNFDVQGRIDEFNTFMFGGIDTTSTAIAFIMYLLGNKPHLQDQLYEEIMEVAQHEEPTLAKINQMNFLDRFIKECLRIYSPATFIGRCLDEDVELPSGYTIPADTLIFIDIFDIHRNPRIYPEPEKFDPDRFLPENTQNRSPYAFIPFSAGPRNCIAQRFAWLHLKCTVCGIVQKFRLESADTLENIKFVPDILLKTKDPLKVKFIPRSTKL